MIFPALLLQNTTDVYADSLVNIYSAFKISDKIMSVIRIL